MKRILFSLFGLAFFSSLAIAQPPGGTGTTTTTTGGGGSTTLEPTPRDGVYDKIHTPNRRVVPYSYLREGDVMWAKRIWRTVDLREKINQPYYYPLTPNNQRKNFITILQDAILVAGVVSAYDPYAGDDFKIKMPSAEVAKIGTRSDTTQLTRPYPPYDTYDTIINEPFRPENVKSFKIKEDWFFDRQRSVMEARILGICPRMANFDPVSGEFRDYSDMYWIYFPQARPVFAVQEVYNRSNFGQRITYDDVFMKRLFSSLIYKVDNEHDRRIDDYVKGIDALLEAENVRGMLFEFEHNLWEQ